MLALLHSVSFFPLIVLPSTLSPTPKLKEIIYKCNDFSELPNSCFPLLTSHIVRCKLYFCGKLHL